MADQSSRIIVFLLIFVNSLFHHSSARFTPNNNAAETLIHECTGGACGMNANPNPIKPVAVHSPFSQPYRPYSPPWAVPAHQMGIAQPLAALADAANAPQVPSAPPLPMKPVEPIPAGEIKTPRERIEVFLNDREFIMLAKHLNLPKLFNEQMKSGKDIGRVRTAFDTIHSQFVFPVYNSFAHAATGLASVDNAMNKVKSDLMNNFGMVRDIGIREGRRRKEFWVYDIFLFRAILEFYNRMFDEAYRHNHILINNTHEVCENCARGMTTGEDAGAADIGTPGGFCPDTTKCKFKIDLDAQKQLNDENFNFIKEFMHSNQVNVLYGGAVEVFNLKFLGEYLPYKFDVRIVDPLTQAMNQFPFMGAHYTPPHSPFFSMPQMGMHHMGMGMMPPMPGTYHQFGQQQFQHNVFQNPMFPQQHQMMMHSPHFPNMMPGYPSNMMGTGHFHGTSHFHQNHQAANGMTSCVRGFMQFNGQTVRC